MSDLPFSRKDFDVDIYFDVMRYRGEVMAGKRKENMSVLKKEWTDEEIGRLTRDINAAKAKVFREWGFTNDEIAKILALPESVVRGMLRP